MEIISEPDWEVLLNKLLQNKGTAMIIDRRMIDSVTSILQI